MHILKMSLIVLGGLMVGAAIGGYLDSKAQG